MDWQTDQTPLSMVLDLDLGEQRTVQLPDGTVAAVKLLGLHEECDSLRGAVRKATVEVEVNGERVSLVSATYNLPTPVGGMQVDCPITRGYTQKSRRNQWALQSDARLRLWPASSPWVTPGSYLYPLRQRWFASATQMANEPTYVDGPEPPGGERVYYHEGLDFGGCEGMVRTVATSDALVVSLAGELLPGHEDTPARAVRKDVVYLLDRRGWYHRHSHLYAVDPALALGGTVKQGQVVGVLGKEGASGGWSHLHYGLSRRQPSGEWGAEDAYAYAWQAYVEQHRPDLIAVARPHHFVRPGETVVVDASRSWSSRGLPLHYDWEFSDGTRAGGPRVERTFPRPGVYSEVLRVIDAEGRVAYDFAIVQVANVEDADKQPAGIHAACEPTFGIRPGDTVTFKVRTFGTPPGPEVWDFGDGTPTVSVQSDGNADHWAPDGYAVTEHSFGKAGDYIVSARRTNEHGYESLAHLHVRVEAD